MPHYSLASMDNSFWYEKEMTLVLSLSKCYQEVDLIIQVEMINGMYK